MDWPGTKEQWEALNIKPWWEMTSGFPSDQGLLWDKAEYSLWQLGIES